MTRDSESSSGPTGPQRGGRASPGRKRKKPAPPEATAQAARFGRVRRDHATELAEDYVELIAQLIATQGEARTVEISDRLGVSHVTVTKRVARLQREGLVRAAPYRSIFLTEQGEKIARQSADRHELVVRFLRKVGVAAPDAEADAEGIEHHLSQATLQAIRSFVERSD